MFAARWRWTATTSLALPRFRSGKKVPPQLQRMAAEDLLATVFPDQVAGPEIETVGLEALTNALIMSLNIDVQEKQKLLEIDDLIARAEEIGRELQNRIESLRFLKPYRRGGDANHN